MGRFVIRTFSLLLVMVLGVAATRDIVCQLACAAPDAAHAAAACHESGDVGGTLLQSMLDHCSTLDTPPALSAIKVNGPQQPSAVLAHGLRSTAWPFVFAPSARSHLPPGASSPSGASFTLVLRI